MSETSHSLPSLDIARSKQEVKALDGDLNLLNNRVKHLELELSKVQHRNICHEDNLLLNREHRR